jgi:hypothetical protein
MAHPVQNDVPKPQIESFRQQIELNSGTFADLLATLPEMNGSVVMDASLRPLPLVSSDEEARRFEAMVDAMAGMPQREPTPRVGFPTLAEFGRLLAAVERLEHRVETLEAELVPPHRSRKCPRCHQLSLVLITSRPHPEFGAAGIEQHEVRCDCGYRASRLYDPSDFLC